ncbi:NAD(P)-binding protein [Sodiomyces alkalinus F11]|uniref:NAD(P)-binding protein n=1 Tax=Sodiomyces alkalinus (strain CBS 110278 / VKM F-3762 / F11) TaxID=1314773 RepID=A0A3N2Q563_SODAK|nr:NAD(P)-binding protein [Sodiomyces alkalinus F11]ROT41837.1 NAD(P)-binding protein [Sodiomyces alkalinus F11]
MRIDLICEGDLHVATWSLNGCSNCSIETFQTPPEKLNLHSLVRVPLLLLAMPLEIAFHVLENGPPQWVRDNVGLLIKTLTTLAVLTLAKIWFNGASSLAERDMYGRVVMVTGGTSGIGSRVAFELARRGAQLVLLTQAPVSDPFLVDHINDLRERTKNNLIYAEQVNLTSLHSIRQFATKWIDNSPPRRLDMIILAAATFTTPGQPQAKTEDGVEETWMVNYLANFHLLAILSPALRAQPFDRDVRVIFTTCSSYIGAGPLSQPLEAENWSPGAAYKRSKLALMTFGVAFQKHLDAYKRPDGLPMNARVVFVDPGYARSPGMRRWLTRGSLWGLLLYLVAYPLPWLFLKSPLKGAQSILYAAMDQDLGRGAGGRMIKECREVDFARKDVHDEELAKKLWEESDALIEKVEKEQALKRAEKKEREEEKAKEAAEAEKTKEFEGLVDAIKKGKETQKSKGKKKARKADTSG